MFHLGIGTPSVVHTFTQGAADVAQCLSEACHNQVIVKPCAFALVLVAQKSHLADYGHIGYRHMVLNAGFVCSALYREAMRCSLGTTVIGGFSDDKICHLIGDTSVYPIVIQVFGIPSASANKADAARIIDLSLQQSSTKN